MFRCMMFCKVVCQFIEFSFIPVYAQVPLCFSVSEPMVPHVPGLWSFLSYVFICKGLSFKFTTWFYVLVMSKIHNERKQDLPAWEMADADWFIVHLFSSNGHQMKIPTCTAKVFPRMMHFASNVSFWSLYGNDFLSPNQMYLCEINLYWFIYS